MLKVINNKGFQMTFANGWTVSVVFGSGNYCENRWEDIPHPAQVNPSGEIECINAEIAAWDKDGNWHRFDHDDVSGWHTPNEVTKFINMIAAKE